MFLKNILAAALFAGTFGAAAQAGEWANACVDRLEADGRDTSGCACLEAEIIANPSLEEEFIALGEIEDPVERYSTASADAQAAMNKCTR